MVLSSFPSAKGTNTTTIEQYSENLMLDLY